MPVMEGAAATDVDDAGRDFQSLMDQSSPVDRKRSPKSMGPRAGWKSKLVTGAVWPLYRNRTSVPAPAPARSYRWQG